MRVTISRHEVWHKNISAARACQLIGCRLWMLQKAIEDDIRFKGWKIKEVKE